jgi:D-apionolactonase
MKNLRAGRLSLQYSEGSLWNICLGNEEIIRRIYIVFQDINWTSRPFNILNETWDIQDDQFYAELDLSGTKDATAFQVKLHISGSSDGVISYGFKGTSSADFMRNRLGLCLLHPIADLAGKPCTLTLSDRSLVSSQFPLEISPLQPFKNLLGMSYKISTGELANIEFSGEIFETEDHRNWSDASYKTYCTPIDLPFPAKVLKGSIIEQEIRFSLAGVASKSPKLVENEILVSVSNSEVGLPDFGLNLSDEYSDVDHKDFNQLGIKHLRLNLDLDSHSEASLIKAIELTKKLNLKLVIAVKADTSNQVSEYLSTNLNLLSEVSNFLILAKTMKVTPKEFITSARKVLGTDVSISGGTDLYFTEINRSNPVVPGIDQINFSLNPQVHSFDDRTIIQNLATQEVIALNAARIAGGLKVSIGPISLRPRFNPNAREPENDSSNTPLPSSVDIRQSTWFTEAWTAISMKYLAQSGAINSATYFETVGWRGIRERSQGTTDQVNFPSMPGEKFPVWNLFTSLKGFSKCILSYSSNPESVDSLVIRNSQASRLILVNFSGEGRQVHFKGLDLPPVGLPPSSTTYLDI